MFKIYAMEVVRGVYAQIEESGAEPSEADWAHQVGLAAQRHNLTELQVKLLMTYLPGAVERLARKKRKKTT